MNVPLSRIATVVMALSLFARGSALAQDDPYSEKALPTTTPKANLPSERDLPVALRTTPLPSEAALPAADTASSQEPLQPDGGPRVWLRLDLPGHTAPVRVLAFTRDASRLWSGGEDKVAHLWQSNDRGGWMRQGVARWDVTRSGASGRIYVLAASQDAMALGGSRAYGNRGDILLFDPRTGRRTMVLGKAEDGHQRDLTALAFSPNGQRLASADYDGRVLVWNRDPATGQWSPQEIQPSDEDAGRGLPPDARSFFPLAWRDDHRLLLPQHLGAEAISGREYLKWGVQEIDVRSMAQRTLPRNGRIGVHWDRVTSMTVAHQTGRLFTADASGLTYHWNLADDSVQLRRHDAAVISMAASERGDVLALGFAADGNGRGRFELWQVPAAGEPVKSRARRTTGGVYGVAISRGWAPRRVRRQYSRAYWDRQQRPADLVRKPRAGRSAKNVGVPIDPGGRVSTWPSL